MSDRAWGDEAAEIVERDGKMGELRDLEREAEAADDFVGVAIIRGWRLDAGDPHMTPARVTAPLA